MGPRVVSKIDQWLTQTGLVVVYDGLCPFCSAYTRMLRLRQSAGPVELVDARGGNDLIADFARRGFPLDDGMIAIYGSRLYFGSDAVALLSQLTTPSGFANRAVALLLRNPARARLIYPVLKSGRALALFLLRRPALA